MWLLVAGWVTSLTIVRWGSSNGLTVMHLSMGIIQSLQFCSALSLQLPKTDGARALSIASSARAQLKWAILELARLESIRRTADDERALERQRAEVAGLRAQLADAYSTLRGRSGELNSPPSVSPNDQP
jgi:hypothetical protein